MQTIHQSHLSYCTNIHAGETWQEVFESLQQHTLNIKHKLTSNQESFGIGLRLSALSAQQLLLQDNLKEFKTWLLANHLYVFTINGFPYGDFHDVALKDQVHAPDWTTEQRKIYTLNLIKILGFLLPEGVDGGISTSPISYKYWFSNADALQQAKQQATQSLAEIVAVLIETKQRTGKTIHIDIEPEPDGIIENTQEFVAFYVDFLLEKGVDIVKNITNLSTQNAKQAMLEHIQLCYDVCHFALVFEHPEQVINTLSKHGIRVGKIQISAALKCNIDENNIKEQLACLRQFDEPTYLHQAILKHKDGILLHYKDLKEGLERVLQKDIQEIRTHFHVPIFLDSYEKLQSTQQDILETLRFWLEQPFTKHLEVETYTWGVLPKEAQVAINESIVREIQWVNEVLKTDK